MKALVTPRSFAGTGTEPLDILREAGLEVVLNRRGRVLTEDELIADIAGCEGLIIGIDPMTRRTFEHAPALRAVAKYGVGTDNIDLEAAQQRNIPVSVTRGANAPAVADYAFALMLAAARKVVAIDAACRKGDWGKRISSDVHGKTLGIVGLGAIGKEMAQRARGFGMAILAADVDWDEKTAATHGVVRSDVREICARADFISLHTPLTDETRYLIGSNEIALMKPNAIVINTARGGLVDEAALYEALRDRRIAAAGLDVFETEPPDESWYALDNVVLGSHCAAATEGAARAMGMQAARNLVRDLGL